MATPTARPLTLAVFASEKGPGDAARADTMSQVGSFLAKKGARILCAVGKEGVSVPLVKSARAAGGEVTLLALEDFIAPSALAAVQVERLADAGVMRARLHELADAYIGLPGSLSSATSMFATWSAIGGQKPVALFNRNRSFEIVRGFGVDILAHSKKNWERDLLVSDNLEDLWNRLGRMLAK